MRKKLLCLLLVLIMPVMVLAGCVTIPQIENFTSEENTRFVFVKKFVVDQKNNKEGFKILVDKETKVMYLYYHDGNLNSGTGGLTVMLNADGTPMLWEGEL